MTSLIQPGEADALLQATIAGELPDERGRFGPFGGGHLAGALVTAVGGMLAARFIMGWTWSLSALFGSLVVVTGPTVITPLLRRIKVSHKVETILEAEGVLIDAVGAVLAIVTLEVVLSFSAASLAEGAIRLAGLLGRFQWGTMQDVFLSGGAVETLDTYAIPSTA